MKEYRMSECIFFISVLNALTAVLTWNAHFIRVWVGPTAGLGVLKTRKMSPPYRKSNHIPQLSNP